MSDLRQRYESHRYEFASLAHAHPARLAAAARLNGIDPPDPKQARVLELGCGDGLGLMAIAQYLPGSRCVGVDFARNVIERGQQVQRDAGLTNVELICRDLQEPFEGEFDYIIVHGVFCWVADTVRRALLETCRKHLAPNGIAFISYNALPGWKTQQGLRELAFRTVGQPSDTSGVDRARRIFDALAQTWGNGQGLDTWKTSAQAAASPNRRLLHDDLAEFNDPYYLTDFVQLAKQHGLNYLCDAQSPLGSATLLPPRIRQVVQELGLGELESEQLADFALMVGFHRTVLVRDDALRTTQPLESLLGGFVFSTTLRPVKDSTSEFVTLSGLKFQLHHPTQRAIVAKLADDAPTLYGLEELTSIVGDADKVKAAMLPMVSAGLVWAATRAGWPAIGAVSEHPKVWPLGRATARHERMVISTTLDATELDQNAAGLVEKMDGQRSIGELCQNAIPRPTERSLRELVRRLAKLGLLQP